MQADFLLNSVALLNDKQFQAIQTTWHQDEVEFREEELYRRQIEDARRTVTEQAEQLKAISSLSALIAGFALIVQTNVSLDDVTLDPYLLYSLALTTAVVVSYARVTSYYLSLIRCYMCFIYLEQGGWL